MITYDNLDEAIAGRASVWDSNEKVERVIYDGERIVDLLMCDGMTEVEALEWVEFNIEGGYLGKETPIVMWGYDSDGL